MKAQLNWKWARWSPIFHLLTKDIDKRKVKTCTTRCNVDQRQVYTIYPWIFLLMRTLYVITSKNVTSNELIVTVDTRFSFTQQLNIFITLKQEIDCTAGLSKTFLHNHFLIESLQSKKWLCTLINNSRNLKQEKTWFLLMAWTPLKKQNKKKQKQKNWNKIK